MRTFFAAVMLSAALIVPAGAADTPQQTAMKTCAANWSAMSAADKTKTKHNDYMSTCLKGGGASSAAMTAKPAAAAAMTAKPAAAAGSMTMAAPNGGHAKCKDGTTVTYKNRQGTCSGHGGVATWM
jgi:hypothetical protein